MITNTVPPPGYINYESEKLPSYSKGIEVHPANLDPDYEVKIDISNPRDVYDIGDIICGVVKFSPPRPIKISSVFVIIEGKERTRRGWLYHHCATKHIKLAYYILPIIPDDFEVIPGGIYTFPFTLQIPELLPIDHCKCNRIEHLRIPPSVDTRSGIDIADVNIQQKAASISYHLGACVKVEVPNNSLINNKYQTLQNIRIVPSYSLSIKEAAKIANHPHSVHKSIKTSLLRKSEKTTIALSLGRLETLSIVDNSRKPLAVPLQITLDAVSERDVMSVFQIQRVGVSLLAHTSYKCEASVSSSHSGAPETSTQKFVLPPLISPISAWKLCPSGSGSNNGAVYTVGFDIPIILHINPRQLVPNFESCLMSRHYSLAVTVFFKGNSIGIEIPVNIVRNPLSYSIAPYSETLDLVPPAMPSKCNYSDSELHSVPDMKHNAPAGRIFFPTNGPDNNMN